MAEETICHMFKAINSNRMNEVGDKMESVVKIRLMGHGL